MNHLHLITLGFIIQLLIAQIFGAPPWMWLPIAFLVFYAASEAGKESRSWEDWY
jgi:hypothetical protein